MARKPNEYDNPPRVLADPPKESWWACANFYDRAHAEQMRMRSTRFGVTALDTTAENAPKPEKRPKTETI
jgi:hypothetical protein